MNKEKSIICGPKNESLNIFIENFKENYPDFLNKNVIVDLTQLKTLSNSEILLFLNTAKSHADAQTSFVVIAPRVDVDRLPEELVIAPTLLEAMDIIEMDEISRDLGF